MQRHTGDPALGDAFRTGRPSWRGKDCIFVGVGDEPGPRLAGRFKSVTVKRIGMASNGVQHSITNATVIWNRPMTSNGDGQLG